MIKRFNLFLKSTIIIFSLLSIGLIVFVYHKIYTTTFRLSYEEIKTSLENNPTQCKKFVNCKLIPGDIIIRRYVTKVTDLFSKTLNPYFTHSAFYFGNDELFEAVGNYGPPKDQILITKLSKSDWFDENMNNFIIIRPKNYNGKLDDIISGLRGIANDSEYVFGPLQEGKKMASCSDIILKYLEDEGVLTNLYKNPDIITPDYLFWVIEKDPSNFGTVGYDINPK